MEKKRGQNQGWKVESHPWRRRGTKWGRRGARKGCACIFQVATSWNLWENVYIIIVEKFVILLFLTQIFVRLFVISLIFAWTLVLGNKGGQESMIWGT